VRAGLLDGLLQLVTSSPLTYLVVLAIVAVDAFFPVVPGETAVITAAILASSGELSVVLVLAAAFAGALGGDNVSYLLGRTLGSPAARLLFRGERSRHRLEWAREQLRVRGRGLIVAARFIPGGRTATTFAAGSLGMSWPRFLSAALVGAALWAVYATALGYVGGQQFRDSLWKPLLLALGVAALIGTATELLRRLKLDS
jgi:membrane-associated protein